jgi:hypothetical protein
MEINEISAVRKGAGAGTKIVFYKSDSGLQDQLDRKTDRLLRDSAPQNRAAGISGEELRAIAQRKKRTGKKIRRLAGVEKTAACERFVRAGVALPAGTRLIAKQDKKEAKAAAKRAKKEAKARAKAQADRIARDRDTAEQSASDRRSAMSKKSKSDDLFTVCKSIADHGAEAQPAVSGHAIYKSMQAAADRQFGHTKLSAAGRFAAYAKLNPTMLAGALIAKQATPDELDDEDEVVDARRAPSKRGNRDRKQSLADYDQCADTNSVNKATPDINALETEDQTEDPQNDADGLAAYRRLWALSNGNPKKFAELYQSERYKSLVEQDKAANLARVSKAMGLT